MSSFKITIPYTPKPKCSVRLSRRSKGWYNPDSRGMLTTREYVTTHGNIEKPLRGPLLVVVHFRLPIPVSFKGPRRRRLHLLPHAKRPDGDNLEKFLNDSLSGVAWEDDAQISWLLRSKSITASKIGSTTIFAKEIHAGKVDYKEIMLDLLENIDQKEENRQNEDTN